MLFNSVEFAIFLLIVYVLYVLTMRRLRAQNAMLLVASYVFYGWWDWRFLGLLLGSTVVDYACARWIDPRVAPPGSVNLAAAPLRRPPTARRRVLLISVFVNLGVLGVFKYYDFFADSLAEALTALGVQASPMTLGVLLPVGISFYTFQTLSYTIDVYRGDLPAHRSFVEFALFVSFFPQLVAGPIVRATDLLPQIARPRTLSLRQTYDGGRLLFWGLFKKLVLADNLALIADRIFEPGATHHGGAVLVGVYAFALQIYCDFSGYTDMARGCSKLLGIELPLNFNLPYLATNPVEFWRRWHITLSTWLRDYLYIPLGGSRRGPRRTAINLMLTMILGGLWHGAAWTFVLWGAYQGTLLVAYKAVQPWWMPIARRLDQRGGRAWRATCTIAFFQLVCLGWLMFRAESVGQVSSLLDRILSPWAYWWIVGAVGAPSGIWIVSGAAVLLLGLQLSRRGGEDGALAGLPVAVRAAAYSVMFIVLAAFGVMIERPFVYFQF
ncbi:MAG: hypothetical protein FLDDKLPJ_01051 [Phycisphaerae bacterium]|nr:hypothetical protein [Phycisphaerae bacterium]